MSTAHQPQRAPFRPTHHIRMKGGLVVPVMLGADGNAHMEKEWLNELPPGCQCADDGTWTWCGAPLADSAVTRVSHRPLRPGEVVPRVPLSVRVSPAVRDLLRQAAERRGVSVGDIVTELSEGL